MKDEESWKVDGNLGNKVGGGWKRGAIPKTEVPMFFPF